MMGEVNMEIEIDIDIDPGTFMPPRTRPVPASPAFTTTERPRLPSRISLSEVLTQALKEVRFPAQLDRSAGHTRANSDGDMSTPHSFHFRNFSSPLVDDGNAQDSPSTETASASTTPGALLNSIEEQMQQWSISDDARGSQDTRSTMPLPVDGILRHQKRESEDTIKEKLSPKQYSSTEVQYLRHVLNYLSKFLVERAFGESGIRYRQTFCWKFYVIAS
jgi:hypothetical protein